MTVNVETAQMSFSYQYSQT